LPLLTKVTLGALFVNALAYAAELLRLGPFDPEVSAVVALLLVASVLVATGWRWTPLLGGLLAGAIILGNPFLLINLSDPGVILFFAATVVEVVSGLTALLGGIAATIQNYRAADDGVGCLETPTDEGGSTCCRTTRWPRSMGRATTGSGDRTAPKWPACWRRRSRSRSPTR